MLIKHVTFEHETETFETILNHITIYKPVIIHCIACIAGEIYYRGLHIIRNVPVETHKMVD